MAGSAAVVGRTCLVPASVVEIEEAATVGEERQNIDRVRWIDFVMTNFEASALTTIFGRNSEAAAASCPCCWIATGAGSAGFVVPRSTSAVAAGAWTIVGSFTAIIAVREEASSATAAVSVAVAAAALLGRRN